MIDCINAEVRDALPDLFNGKLSEADAAIVQDHVDGCADCRSELDLLREVKAASPMVPAMNASAIASKIPAYGPASVTRVRRTANSFAWAWKAAAGVVIVAAGMFGLTRESPSRQATGVVAPAAPVVAAAPVDVDRETSSPASAEKTAVNSAPKETQVASLSLGGLQDLSDADIEELLSDLNGLEAIPSAEPQSVTPVIDDAGVEQ